MAIKLYKSPRRAITLLLLCSIFVVGGLYMLQETNAPKWVAWMNIGFFGLGLPVGLFHLFDRRPQILINEIGIYDRTMYKDFINWEVIRDAYPINISGQKYICLIVDEKYEPSWRKGKFSKTMADLSKGIGAQELNIWLGQIVIDEIKLTQFIQTMVRLGPENRKEKLKEISFAK